MKTLLLMRHAKSSWQDASLPDHDRPLNARGKRDAPRMGQWLREQDLVPELIVSSSARRARKTADKVAAACHYPHEVLRERSLYHAGPEDWYTFVRTLPADVDRALCIGHNPGLEEFVYRLTLTYVRMTTAAIAHIRLPVDAWSELDNSIDGELVDVWRPKELPA